MSWLTKKKPIDREVTLEIVDKNISFKSKDDKKIVLDILKKNNLKEIKSLTESIQFLNTRQLLEKKKLDDIIKDQNQVYENIKTKANKDLSKYECSICYENEIEYVLYPCGHTFCGKCISENECYICRKTNVQKVKLFFN